MQKTGWTNDSSFLVWKRVSLWIWSQGGSQQPFSSVFGHFRHGDEQTTIQTNNQQGDLEQACSWSMGRKSFAILGQSRPTPARPEMGTPDLDSVGYILGFSQCLAFWTGRPNWPQTSSSHKVRKSHNWPFRRSDIWYKTDLYKMQARNAFDVFESSFRSWLRTIGHYWATDCHVWTKGVTN